MAKNEATHAVALEAYGRIRHEARFADRVLNETLRSRKDLHSRERRLVAEQVYTALRHQYAIDRILAEEHGDRQRSQVELDALHLAAARIIAGEAPGDVAGSTPGKVASPALLSQFVDWKAHFKHLDDIERLSLIGSVPPFVVEQLREQYGAATEVLLDALNQRAPLTVRVNTLKTTRESLLQQLSADGIHAVPTSRSPLGITLHTRLNAYGTTAFRSGMYEIQDEGSQLLGALVDAPPTRVVDACAGAGGKTLQLAAQMRNRGDLLALDVDARRLGELKLRARRAGVHNVRIRPIPEGDEAASAFTDWAGTADRVFVDAPCSGTGAWRRKPDGRYHLTPSVLADHVVRQKQLLQRFSTLVKPGGRLVYGTCSLLRCENDEVVEHFLKGNQDFELHEAEPLLSAAVPATGLTQGPYLKLSPHVHGTDGFFGAVLKRRNRRG